MASYPVVRTGPEFITGSGWTNADYSRVQEGSQLATCPIPVSGQAPLVHQHYNLMWPRGTRVYGIQVRVRGAGSAGSVVTVSIKNNAAPANGRIYNQSKTIAALTSVGDMIVGGATDLWDGGWTIEALMSRDFLVEVSCNRAAGASGTFQVDVVELTVWTNVGISIRKPGAASGSWTSPTNAVAEDYNTASSVSSTSVLSLTTFGHAIPAGARILGMRARVRTYASAAGKTIQVGIFTNTTVYKAAVAVPTPAPVQWLTFGNGCEDLWGQSPTVANVNSGSQIAITPSSAAVTVYVDTAEFWVWYQNPPYMIDFETGLRDPTDIVPYGYLQPVFKDDFSDSAFSSGKFGFNSSAAIPVSVTGGYLQFGPTTSTSGTSMVNYVWQDMEESQTTIRIQSLTALANLNIIMYQITNIANCYFYIVYSNTVIWAQHVVNGVTTDLGSVVATPSHLRITHTGGWTYFEYAVSGTFQTLVSIPNPMPLSMAYTRIDCAKNYTGGAAITLLLDDFETMQAPYTLVLDTWDDFNDTVLDPMWQTNINANTPVTEADGTLNFVNNGQVGFSMVGLAARDCRNVSSHVHLAQLVAAVNHYDLFFRWTLDGNNYLEIMVVNGTVTAASNVSGVGTLLSAWVTATPTHVQIRTVNDRVYYEYSTDGAATWIQLAQTPAPFSLSKLYVQMYSGMNVAGAAGTTKIGAFQFHRKQAAYDLDFSWDQLDPDIVNYWSNTA